MAFLKIEKNRQFTYIPRFYNEQKEELKERIKKAKARAQQPDSDEYVPNLKGQFRKRHESIWGKPYKSNKRSMVRWLMLIFYATMVIAIIYLAIDLLSKLQ